MILFAALVFIGLPVLLASVFSFLLVRRFPAVARWKRVAIAGLSGGMVPVIPALIAVARSYGTFELTPFFAVFTLGLIMGALVGIPAAIFATRPKAPVADISTFD